MNASGAVIEELPERPAADPRGSQAVPAGVSHFHPCALVSAEDLLQTLWPLEKSRPTVKWVRSMQERKLLPYKKIGRLVFFDIHEVRRAIDRNFSVAAVGE